MENGLVRRERGERARALYIGTRLCVNWSRTFQPIALQCFHQVNVTGDYRLDASSILHSNAIVHREIT